MEYFYSINRIYSGFIFRTLKFTKCSHLHYLFLGYLFFFLITYWKTFIFLKYFIETKFLTGHKNNENTDLVCVDGVWVLSLIIWYVLNMLLFSHQVVYNSFVIPSNCSLPGSFVHGTSQERILACVAVSISRESSRPGIKPTSSALAGRFFITQPPGKPIYGYR